MKSGPRARGSACGRTSARALRIARQTRSGVAGISDMRDAEWRERIEDRVDYRLWCRFTQPGSALARLVTGGGIGSCMQDPVTGFGCVLSRH